VQIVVDGKNKLIVAQETTQNGNDTAQLSFDAGKGIGSFAI
jgi:hypothetical protein